MKAKIHNIRFAKSVMRAGLGQLPCLGAGRY
ncbi:hypothetical protein DET1254 [Dehalococcoides mccartyi 195]|uniref:Uncharacterized protein n=1 Tax=Dehalococcoides mccartyi (strain ATCC BAA-2266 / KCTC 15142 / 195) TaxID=243164 RepID=Q3Z733_DEHM1|nr:hypothetical protein DET1254 [Dehalococcoides mccartyi 195]